MSRRKRNTMNAPTRRSVRAKMFERQGGRCFYCETAMTIDKAHAYDDNYATFEHLTPVSDGGDMNPRNIVLACRRCNERRGDMSVDEFRRLVNE